MAANGTPGDEGGQRLESPPAMGNRVLLLARQLRAWANPRFRQRELRAVLRVTVGTAAESKLRPR